MNVVDSSAWLAYLAGEPNARHFAEPITQLTTLLVPTVVIFEVCKVTRRESGDLMGEQIFAILCRGQVVPLSATLAHAAAKLSQQYRLPFVDSIILATAQSLGAAVWTQDSHFAGLAGVKYFPKV